jgi:hypothetical protein
MTTINQCTDMIHEEHKHKHYNINPAPLNIWTSIKTHTINIHSTYNKMEKFPSLPSSYPTTTPFKATHKYTQHI